MDIGDALWQMWLLYWVSGALVGSFLGTLLALITRALYNKIVKLIREDD